MLTSIILIFTKVEIPQRAFCNLLSRCKFCKHFPYQNQIYIILTVTYYKEIISLKSSYRKF